MARYSRLPNPQSATDEELEAAFENSDNEDEVDDIYHTPRRDTTKDPLLPTSSRPSSSASTSHPLAQSTPTFTAPNNSGAYDFEYEYPPPPGSPPPPSSLAIPNSIGNSNGLLPSSPVVEPSRSFLQNTRVGRALRSVFPGRRTEANQVGGGQENDGVFANVTAKPAPQRAPDGVGIAPEITPDDAPPSYQVAQLDAVPPYWETTILAPTNLFGSDIVIEQLPTGSLLYFMWSLLISVSFQFVGFALTYMLHTTHAAKYGSRAGLGITLIQTGFYMREGDEDDVSQSPPWSTSPTPTAVSNSTANPPPITSQPAAASVMTTYVSFALMVVGWYLVVGSFLGYARVKRIEHALQNPSPPPVPPTDEELEREARLRETLEAAFGIGIVNRPRESNDTETEPETPTAPEPRRRLFEWV